MKSIHALLKRDIPSQQLRLLWNEVATTPCPTTIARYVREFSRSSSDTRNMLTKELLSLHAPSDNIEYLLDELVAVAYGLLCLTLEICRELNNYKISPKNRRLIKRTIFKNEALWVRFDHKFGSVMIANNQLYEEIRKHSDDRLIDSSFVLCSNFVITKDFLRYHFMQN